MWPFWAKHPPEYKLPGRRSPHKTVRRTSHPEGHGLCSTPGSLVPAHQHLNSLGWGFQGTALSQATVRHQVFCVVLKTAVYSALFILFLDFQSFIISVLRDVNPLVREDLIHHGCAPNAYSIMNHWVNSKSEGMEINMCIAS